MADVIANMADVVAMFLIGRCYCLVADVVATNCVLLIWQMLLPGGWCYCHYYVVMFFWQMLLPGG